MMLPLLAVSCYLYLSLIHILQRCRIAAEIANELWDMAEQLPATPFMEDYIAHNLVPGKEIFVIQNGTRRPARALSITPDGHLLIENSEGKTEELSFGEVSIRVKQGGSL